MGMVVLLLFTAFLLTFVVGCMANQKKKYLYPLMVSVVFLPSVWIYYNETALIYLVWYAVITAVGILIGTGVRKLFGMLRGRT